MNKKIQNVIVCILPIVVVFALMVLKVTYESFISEKFLPCWFNLLTGYLCPGCGGTRSFFSLMQGDLLASFKYNAFVPIIIIFAIITYIRLFIKLVLEKDIDVFPKNDKFIYIPLTLFLIYFIVRNLFI